MTACGAMPRNKQIPTRHNRRVRNDTLLGCAPFGMVALWARRRNKKRQEAGLECGPYIAKGTNLNISHVHDGKEEAGLPFGFTQVKRPGRTRTRRMKE